MPKSDLKVIKTIINIGVGQAVSDKKVLESASADLAAITGQKPKSTAARASIAGFKIRQGDKIGLMVTLRGKRQTAFLEKLFNIVLPKLRDFQGVSRKSFDGHGSYNLGISEQIVFPEIDYTKVDKVRGMQITFVTNAKTDQEAMEYLEKLGMPFEKITGTKS